MAYPVPEQLQDAAKRVKDGQEVVVTVRDLLAWFYSERRGHWIVRMIRQALRKLDIKTEPDFDSVWLGASISIVPAGKEISTGSRENGAIVVEESPSEVAGAEDSEIVSGKTNTDPTNRIGRLESANKPPTTVNPDATIEEATTLMLLHDFSQLPVTTSEFQVRGLISWKSIGRRLALGH